MTVLQAILPVLGLLAGGACVGAFAYFGKRKHEKDGPAHRPPDRTVCER